MHQCIHSDQSSLISFVFAENFAVPVAVEEEAYEAVEAQAQKDASALKVGCIVCSS
jgi:hypothetical protein